MWLLLAAGVQAEAQEIYKTQATLSHVCGKTYRLTCVTWTPDAGHSENGILENHVPPGWSCSPTSYPVVIKIKHPPGIYSEVLTEIVHDVFITVPRDKTHVTVFTRVAGEIKGKTRIPKP
jgi:hypothetical protein